MPLVSFGFPQLILGRLPDVKGRSYPSHWQIEFWANGSIIVLVFLNSPSNMGVVTGCGGISQWYMELETGTKFTAGLLL